MVVNSVKINLCDDILYNKYFDNIYINCSLNKKQIILKNNQDIIIYIQRHLISKNILLYNLN